MKQTLLRLSIAAICAAGLSDCRQSANEPDPNAGTIIKPSPARPVLTYYGRMQKGSTTTAALFVMDSDGRHQTPILTDLDTSTIYASPSWSPTGNSVCITKWGFNVVPDTIATIDVSIGPNGSPLQSNVRTIVGLSQPGTIYGSVGTGTTLGYAYCSSTAAMGKIAYSATDGDKISLCVIPETGGTPNVIWTGLAWEDWLYCSWSPDDSRLAVCRVDGGYGHNYIMIFNTSTWKCVDSVAVTGMIWGLDWSRRGLDKIAFGRSTNYNGPYYLYYCDPKTGSTPTTNGIMGGDPSWSPNNSSVVCQNANGLLRVTAFTHNTSVICQGLNSPAKWKR